MLIAIPRQNYKEMVNCPNTYGSNCVIMMKKSLWYIIIMFFFFLILVKTFLDIIISTIWWWWCFNCQLMKRPKLCAILTEYKELIFNCTYAINKVIVTTLLLHDQACDQAQLLYSRIMTHYFMIKMLTTVFLLYISLFKTHQTKCFIDIISGAVLCFSGTCHLHLCGKQLRSLT